jgi:hypothetical protein
MEVFTGSWAPIEAEFPIYGFAVTRQLRADSHKIGERERLMRSDPATAVLLHLRDRPTFGFA